MARRSAGTTRQDGPPNFVMSAEEEEVDQGRRRLLRGLGLAGVAVAAGALGGAVCTASDLRRIPLNCSWPRSVTIGLPQSSRLDPATLRQRASLRSDSVTG